MSESLVAEAPKTVLQMTSKLVGVHHLRWYSLVKVFRRLCKVFATFLVWNPRRFDKIDDIPDLQLCVTWNAGYGLAFGFDSTSKDLLINRRLPTIQLWHEANPT